MEINPGTMNLEPDQSHALPTLEYDRKGRWFVGAFILTAGMSIVDFLCAASGTQFLIEWIPVSTKFPEAATPQVVTAISGIFAGSTALLTFCIAHWQKQDQFIIQQSLERHSKSFAALIDEFASCQKNLESDRYPVRNGAVLGLSKLGKTEDPRQRDHLLPAKGKTVLSERTKLPFFGQAIKMIIDEASTTISIIEGNRILFTAGELIEYVAIRKLNNQVSIAITTISESLVNSYTRLICFIVEKNSYDGKLDHQLSDLLGVAEKSGVTTETLYDQIFSAYNALGQHVILSSDSVLEGTEPDERSLRLQISKYLMLADAFKSAMMLRPTPMNPGSVKVNILRQLSQFSSDIHGEITAHDALYLSKLNFMFMTFNICNFRAVEINRVTFFHCNFYKCSFEHAVLSDCNFINCVFEDTDWENSAFFTEGNCVAFPFK
jgi:hypothetical protein